MSNPIVTDGVPIHGDDFPVPMVVSRDPVTLICHGFLSVSRSSLHLRPCLGYREDIRGERPVLDDQQQSSHFPARSGSYHRLHRRKYACLVFF
ncbi:Palmdelphin [Frankliniella fusca]|uniref:Palmdelphin n=1 Tax=Frankliniella fusca TaxID=407009 RepID=A0AAE1LBW5_9NEOP|nr:Palmdelphin [Frankliniella fusca]